MVILFVMCLDCQSIADKEIIGLTCWELRRPSGADTDALHLVASI